MANNSIEEVKTIIRGLLVSSPVEVTVLKLRRDFKAQEGQDIPFYEFGFRDVTTFLRSIPDVCKVCKNDSGPYAIVKLVESVKSAHVSSLVLRQKTTFKGKRRHSSFSIKAKPSRMCVKPAIGSFRNKTGPLRFEVQKNGYLPKTDFSFSSYNEVSNKNHSNLPDLPVYNSVHQACNGYDNNVETWLYGNEEQCEVQDNYPCIPDASGSEFVDLEPIVDQHLRDILISDEGLALKDVEEYLRDVLSTSETNYGDLNAVNFEQIIRNLPYVRILDNYIYHEQFLISEYEELHPEESFNKPESPIAEIKEPLEVKSSKNSEKGELTAHASPFVPQGINDKAHRLERNLHSLMKDNVHGILGSELREKYKMKFAAPLNFQILGCENTQELAFKMPHIFSYVPLENGAFKLFPYGYPLERTSKGEDSRPKVMIHVPEITKRNMQWLMQGYPNGLNSKDFEQTYKDTYLQGVDLKQMGLSSFQEFFQCLEKLNVIKIEVSGLDTWLFPSNNSANLIVFDKPLPFKEIIENEHDLKNIKEQFPRDVVGPDLHVKQVEIPSWVTKGSLIEVLVQEVNNPHHFWLTFCGEQYSRALDSLMDDLQAFYCSKSHSYRMPSEFIREGQDCVTQFVDEWHRARVTSIVSATEVEVYFYDYGTRRIVQKDNIHYLHTAHSALPAQAIRAVLANIAPVGDKWTPDASKRFLHLIANKALIGIVISADFTNKLFSLFLCDTSGDDDIYIHEVLISEGYAVETGFDYNENESNKIDINDLKIEGANSGSLHMMEEECEEKQPNESCDNLDVHIVSPHILNSINHDDTSLQLDTVQVQKSQNSSRISSQSSLPNAMTKDSLNSSPSVSKSFCFDGSSVSSDVSASVVMKTENNSLGHRQQSAPPPGFSHTSKCEIESDASDRTESHTPSVVSGNNRNQQSETELEATKTNASHDIESEERDGVRDTANETSDHGETVKGISSGVNANFSHTKAPYFQNYYAYSNWPTLPQTFPNFPVMPSFPSVNTLAPISMAPFNVPQLPNPLEFCNMWYYEQCRQQAFLQGLLGHQQMAASAFPPLPPGLFLPPSYSTMSSQNHMNISEVQSPDQSPSTKSNFKENSSVSRDACINTATQTEVASVDKGSDTKLTRERSTGDVSSLEAVPEFIPSDFSSMTNEDGISLLKKCSRSEFLESENKDSNNRDVASHFESALEDSSEVTSKDVVENSICGSTFLTIDAFSQGNKFKNDLGLGSQCSVLEDLTKKASSHTNLTSVDDTPHNCNDSQSKIEKACESGYLDKESINVVSAVTNTSVDRSLLEICNLEDQYCKELPLQNILDTQRECNTKSARKEIVHQIDGDVNNVHHLEESEATKMKGSSKISQNINISSAVKGRCTEIEEKEIAQVEFVETPFEEEIDLHEDDCHEQEMIEKAQQEYVMKTCAENNRHTNAAENTSREKKAAIHNKLLAREYLDMIKEEKTNSEVSSGIQTSFCEKYSFESSEKKKVGKGDTKDWLDKFEDTTDHLLEQEHLLTVSQGNSCRNSGIPSIHDSFQESQKTSAVSEMLSAELEDLSISNERQCSIYPRQFVQQSETYREHPGVKAQKQEFHNNLSKVDERIANSVGKAQTNLSKEVQPVIGPKLSSEVSATYISGPTQPAMSQNSHILAPTRCPDQSKDNVSDTLLSCQTASWRTTWSSEELGRKSLQRPLARDSSRNTPFRNSANQSSTNWHKDSSGKRMMSQQFVKKIYLCSKKIHQINLDGRPYVLTDEIVDYFTPFNGRHVILKILEARKVEINFLELSRRRRPELFECLDKSEIVCRGLNRGPTGNVIGSIHIVPLRSVPYMLRALNKDDEALAMEVKEEMEKFDASDPYWTGCRD
ncbi:hypothetical protein R5R35_003323 [Gryllus longicercus]|uniref:Tudor domain-containing protein 5 n=1 Tax=Gryllus longicercus TaxID=2509291 RepID=A0AAN9VFB5_9ORTH